MFVYTFVCVWESKFKKKLPDFSINEQEFRLYLQEIYAKESLKY